MGYNLSDNAFNQVKPILEELLNLSVGSIWKQSFQDNYKAARLIRQGFEYCILNPDIVGKRFVELKQNIRIRATNDYVLAERKFSALEPLNKVGAVRVKWFSGVTTFNEALTIVLANKQLTELVFPNFLESDRFEQFKKVCIDSGYQTYTETNGRLRVLKNAETRTTEEHTD